MTRTHQAMALAWTVALVACAISWSSPGFASVDSPVSSPEVAHTGTSVRQLVEQYCVDCHDRDLKKGGLDLDTIHRDDLSDHVDAWEKVVRKLRARQMPPANKRRPDEATFIHVLSDLESALDGVAARDPNPGRTGTFRRLNRYEYQNAIRDLLGLEIDAAALLPKDESSHGFDNVTVADLSPTLLDRYISAAQKISRLAIGAPRRTPGGDTFRLRPDLTQDTPVEGLPIGTRGGLLIPYTFPRAGEYEIQIRLMRDRNEEVEGLTEPHELEVLLDRERLELFTVTPPSGPNRNFEVVDAHLKLRVPVTAGLHQVGVTFLKNPAALLQTRRQPYNAHFNYHRHPRLGPAIYQVTIHGPFGSSEAGKSPTRDRILVCEPADPTNAAEAAACAERNLSTLMRRAYRRPVTAADLERPMRFFRETAAEEGFESGIEAALSAVLVSPNFLFRIEKDPAGVPPNTAYRVPDLDLATRLAFFLWSSIPDDELLETAIRGDLSKPEVLKQQVLRMLADPRSAALARHFAEQWLQVRNLESITPDLRLFPDFDDNLRQAFRRETELFFSGIVRDDRSVLELLKADYTFLNERLARHYGVPHVYGSRFRRVELGTTSGRGGLLRQGSVLTVTSYAIRTSPVLRGKWVLENLLGTPPPPPLPDVPALDDNTVLATLPVRARLAQHRANAACASCHDLMDPVGFLLENFDAVGRWRTLEDGTPVDSSGGVADGVACVGVGGLEEGLLRRPEVFVHTLTEKLLTYALGRGIEAYDAPAIRKAVREAGSADYSFSSVILGIVNSTPFQMRRSL